MIVAVLGAGIMGAPMARNIAGAGNEVRVWNRTKEKAEALASDAVEVAGSPSEAASGADVVLTMLSDADAVAAAMEASGGALQAMTEGTVWAQMSTIGIAGTERCQAMADERGVPLVDAPVLGTKQPAEQGELVVVASGPEAALERCAPLFDAVGAKTVTLGAAGTGTRLKMVLNHWILALVESIAETAALAEGLGLEPSTFLETIGGGPLDSPYAQTKGGLMVDRDFPPSFALELAHKDARLVLEAASRHDLDLPLARVVEEQLGHGVAAGHGREDMAATYLTSSPRPGG
jgi:3-hydroxyisobutyrate dehydrogenase